MNKKMVKMISAFIILFVLVAAYFGVKSYVAGQEAEETAEEEKETSIFSADVDEIKSLGFLIDKNEVMFEKENDTWVKKDEPDFPVDQDTLTNAAGAFQSLTADRVLEDAEDLSEYELDIPQNTITVTLKDGTKLILRVGMKNESTSQYYVSKDDDKHTVYVVTDASIDHFMKSLYDYAKKETFPDIDSSTITKVEVNKENPYELFKKDNGYWDVSDSNGVMEQADTASVSNLTSSIGNMEYDQLVDYQAEDLSKYGLDDPYAKVVVDYSEEEKSEDETVTSSDVEESDKTVTVEKKLVLSIGDVIGDGRYVQVNDSRQIYTIPEENLDAIIGKNNSDFWSMTVNYLSVNNLSKLVVEKNNEKHMIEVSRETSENDDGEETETVSYKLDNVSLDEETKFTTFYNKVINMSAQKRSVEEYDKTNDPDMKITFTDNDGNETNVDYYLYDTNFYAAVVENKVYLVNKMTVRDMMDAYEKMLGEDIAETE